MLYHRISRGSKSEHRYLTLMATLNERLIPPMDHLIKPHSALAQEKLGTNLPRNLEDWTVTGNLSRNFDIHGIWDGAVHAEQP
jgi:hypothetical protein